MPNAWFQQVVYLQNGNPNLENSPVLNYPGQLGAQFRYAIPSRSAASETAEDGRPHAYQYVRCASSMAVAPSDGATAWWSSQSGYTVTTDPTVLGRGRVAGVFKTAVGLGNYCCIQQGGASLVTFQGTPTAAPTAAGLVVIPSATAGVADCLAAGSAATYTPMGLTMGTATANKALVHLTMERAGD